MSTIEEKILNGPTANYCDAEDDDIRSGDDASSDKEDSGGPSCRNDASSLFVRPNDDHDRLMAHRNRQSGTTFNTGPKGVIEDYLRQKSLGNKRTSNSTDDDLELEFQQLMNDDSILLEYANKRITQNSNSEGPTFGFVMRLRTGSDLLDAIDEEKPTVRVIVHIYTKYSRPCTRVDHHLNELARRHKNVKFLTLDASTAGLSSNFKENGVPALLAYQNGSLIKSLVQLEDLLDKDFDYDQIETLLREEGLIQ